jgi:hypothetical protein
MSNIVFSSGTSIVGNGCLTTATTNPYLYNNGVAMNKKRRFTLTFEETENGFVLITQENKYNLEYQMVQNVEKKFVYNDTNELVKAVSDVIRNK